MVVIGVVVVVVVVVVFIVVVFVVILAVVLHLVVSFRRSRSSSARGPRYSLFSFAYPSELSHSPPGFRAC